MVTAAPAASRASTRRSRTVWSLDGVNVLSQAQIDARACRSVQRPRLQIPLLPTKHSLGVPDGYRPREPIGVRTRARSATGRRRSLGFADPEANVALAAS